MQSKLNKPSIIYPEKLPRCRRSQHQSKPLWSISFPSTPQSKAVGSGSGD